MRIKPARTVQCIYLKKPKQNQPNKTTNKQTTTKTNKHTNETPLCLRISNKHDTKVNE